jgi:H+/Cl- antiporter ClcA
MLALWFVGAAVEMSHGWLAALIIFTLSAVGGSALSAIFLPETISVGASGGIFGTMCRAPVRERISDANFDLWVALATCFAGFIGACLADIIMNWSLLFSDIVSEHGKKHRHAIVVIVLVVDIFLNSIIGLTPFVDNYNRKYRSASFATSKRRNQNNLTCVLLTLQTLEVWFTVFSVASAQSNASRPISLGWKKVGRHKQSRSSRGSSELS